MKYAPFFDGLRFVPLLNFFTMLYYLFESLRHPGKGLRSIRLYGILMVCTTLSGWIAEVIDTIFPNQLVQGLCLLLGIYVTCLAMIQFARWDIRRRQHRL